MRAAPGGAERVEDERAREPIAAGELGADRRVARRQRRCRRARACAARSAGVEVVDGLDEPADQRARQRGLDHGERAGALVAGARVTPRDRGARDRARAAARRDEQQHRVRDLAQPLVEPARDQLVAGLGQNAAIAAAVCSSCVELGVDEAIDRRRRDRQIGEQRGGAIARAPAAPRGGRDQLAGGRGPERGERVLGGGADVVVGLAERARDAAQVVGLDRVGALEQLAVQPQRRGDLAASSSVPLVCGVRISDTSACSGAGWLAPCSTRSRASSSRSARSSDELGRLRRSRTRRRRRARARRTRRCGSPHRRGRGAARATR